MTMTPYMRWLQLLYLFLGYYLLTGCSPSVSVDRVALDAQSKGCYDRISAPHTFTVDSHLHLQPFAGPAIDHEQMLNYLDKMGIQHALVYGIGQTLPIQAACSDVLSCKGQKIKPTIKNDFINAYHVLNQRFRSSRTPQLTLSMSFLDFKNVDDTLQGIALLDREYPGLFRFAGEINLVKQALFANAHQAATIKDINQFKPVMDLLRQRKIPLSIHSDLGNNKNPTQYLSLMEHVLKQYPNNDLVWMHLGLSQELTDIDVGQHIALLQALLDQYPRLMLDLSWRVLYDQYFRYSDRLQQYVAFINKNYARFLTGSDFVASRYQPFSRYQQAVTTTSYIHSFLDDRAFAHIVLGKNYFQLLNQDAKVPDICPAP